MTGPVNATPELLAQFVSRLENLMAERKAIGDDIKDVLAEAKGQGLEDKVLRVLIRRRSKDADAIAEGDALLDLYEDALADIGMGMSPLRRPPDPPAEPKPPKESARAKALREARAWAAAGAGSGGAGTTH